MAEAVTTPETEAAAAPASPQGEEAAPAPALAARVEHRGRFLLVYALLAGVLAAAVAGLVVLLGGGGAEPAPAFAAWEPRSEAPEDRAQEIANFVASRYRLPSGSQLVTVQAAPPRVQDFPLSAVAIASAPDGSTYSGENIPVFQAEDTVVYILCGLGPECAIDEGEPSEERQRLLRRESLELALYTFRYVEGVENVVAFLPPRLGYRASYALFFQRHELEELVGRPLRETLPAPAPPLPEEIPPAEIAVIDELTLPRFFAFQFQQLPNGTIGLVLRDPNRAPPPQPIETAPAEGEGGTAGTGADGTGSATETGG